MQGWKDGGMEISPMESRKRGRFALTPTVFIDRVAGPFMDSKARVRRERCN